MIDYLLKFPSKAVAEQFGIANGFAAPDDKGEVQSSLAGHTHALCVVGEHNGADWWVLFRDLVGIPIPEGGNQFIHWTSASNEPRPISDDVPTIWGAYLD
jgi:hypothetical protein